MSKNILFLSEQFIKDNSFVSDNVDPKQLLPTLKAVQDIQIHPMLGTALYNKLQDLVKNEGTTPIPADYKTLLDDYLADSLLWYTLADLPVPLQFKMVNKGIVTRSGDAMQVASTTDRKELVDYCQNKAQWYSQRVIDYLRANSSKYPEYKSPGSDCSTIHPDKTQYRTGMYLGSTSPRKPRDFGDKYQ